MGRIGFIQDYLYLPFKDFLIKKMSQESFQRLVLRELFILPINILPIFSIDHLYLIIFSL